MANGAANNTSQHITATLVTRQHTVGNQKGRGAQMVSDDSERFVCRIARTQLPGHGRDQGGKQINLII